MSIIIENPSHFLLNLLKEIGTLICGLIVLSSLTLVFILSVPVFIFRFVLCRAAKVFRHDFGNILTAEGNIFSGDYFSSNAPRCSIVVPLTLEGQVTEEAAQSLVKTMLETRDNGKLRYPEFMQYLVKWFGFAFWKDDPNFDIGNHVKSYNKSREFQCDDSPKSDIVTDEEVDRFIEGLLNKKFLKTRSPWEFYIVENYKGRNNSFEGLSTIAILRSHHTLADGYSLVFALMEGLLQSKIEYFKLPKPNYVRRDVWSGLFFNLTFPFRLWYDVSHYMVKALRRNPWLIQDGKKSWKQYYGKGKPYPIDKIKEIKDELKVSFTSVLLASVSASMSRIVRSKYENGKDIERAAFFIPLPLPNHPKGLRNHVTGAQIDMPLEKYPDPTMRVFECEALINKQKRSTIPMFLFSIGRIMGCHTSAICSELTTNRMNVAGLTNFPAGSREIHFGSEQNRVLGVDLAAGALGGVAGVAFMSISYQNQMQFALTAETAVLDRKDVDLLLRLINEELELLYEVAVAKKLDLAPPY